MDACRGIPAGIDTGGDQRTSVAGSWSYQMALAAGREGGSKQ